MAKDLDVTDGRLGGVLPCSILGSGPPLVILRGFTTRHDNPSGLQRRAAPAGELLGAAETGAAG
jgi:hypothetical protein